MISPLRIASPMHLSLDIDWLEVSLTVPHFLSEGPTPLLLTLSFRSFALL